MNFGKAKRCMNYTKRPVPRSIGLKNCLNLLGLAVIPFCSVFDEEGVELMKELDAPAYKIASFEAVDHGLIKQCALTKSL